MTWPITTPYTPRTTATTTSSDIPTLEKQLLQPTLYSLAAQDADVLCQPWVQTVIDIEDRERKRRSLLRRIGNARAGTFKHVDEFGWQWPKAIERALIEEWFSLQFIEEAANVVLLGPNGVGNTMLAKNLVHHAMMNGYTARFTMASDMLHELSSQDSDASLAQRLKRFTGPHLLAIDEVGYLNGDNRYADLLFEVLTRRYLQRPTYHHDQQTLLSMERGVLLSRLCPHPR